MHFLDILVVFRLDLGQISFNLVGNAFCNMTAFDPGMRRNQNFEIVFGCESDLCLEAFWFLEFFFAFPFSPFLFFLWQWLTFYWACLRVKHFQESVIETGNFYHGAARCSGRKFWSGFFAQLIEHFCAYLRLPLPSTLTWASLERSFPPAEIEYRWCQFWSKVMTSDVEERPMLVKGGYGRHRSQWVNTLNVHCYHQQNDNTVSSFLLILLQWNTRKN